MKLEVIEIADNAMFVEIVEPVVLSDIVVTQDSLDRLDIDLSSVLWGVRGGQIYARFRATVKPLVREALESAKIWPMEEYSNRPKESWVFDIGSPFDFRGTRSADSRLNKGSKAYLSQLVPKIERGEHETALLKSINRDIENRVRGNNHNIEIAFMEWVESNHAVGWSEKVLGDVEWATTTGTLAPPSTLQTLITETEAEMEPIRNKLRELEKSLTDAKCDFVLAALNKDEWRTPDGKRIPQVLRDKAEKKLKERSVFKRLRGFI